MLLKGKKGIILGVANARSIGWGIAKMMIDHGAEVAFSYQNERLKSNLDKLLEGISHAGTYVCDVSNPSEIETLTESLKKDLGEIDFIVHSLAFAEKTDLENRFIDTPRDSFLKSIDVSCYSLIAVAKGLESILKPSGSVVALTYLGAVNTIINYNVMGVSKAALESTVRYLSVDLGKKGIRVNAISAGPIQTLAARGIRNFSILHKVHPKIAPLQKAVTIEEVGGVGVFLCSELSTAISSEVIYVDGGFHNVAVGPVDAYNY